MYPLLYAPVGGVRSGLLRPSAAAAASPLTWKTATDWDNATSESGVAHESVSNTDHSDNTVVLQGFSYSNPPQSTDLFAHYPMHENSGSTLNDVAGSQNGTYSGPTLGKTGLLGSNAPSFDGTDDSGVIPEFSFSGNFTAIGWVNIANLSNADQGAIFAGDKNSSGGSMPWAVWYENANNTFEIYDGSSTSLGSTTVSTDTWYMVTIRFDGTDMDLSVNDSFAETTITNTSVSSSGKEDTIGARATSSDSINGRVCEVLLYTAALSNSTLQSIYDTVATTGTLTTATKSFSSAQSPDLVADAQLNGVTDVAVDVIGSPSGTSETNTVQVNQNGSNTYTITWSSSHTNFRVKPKPDNESDPTRTPTINKLELSP